PYTHFDYVSTQNDIVVNGLTGVTINMGPSDIRWTNLYVHSTSKEARTRSGIDGAAGREVRDDFTEWYERELLSTQLASHSEITDSLSIDWRAAYSSTTRDAPYEKQIRYLLNRSDTLYALNNANRT